MRLINFQIKNYRSIIDSGVVKLSELDNVSVFAGQNESGKSSILKALYNFERGEFETDSIPFSIDANPIQSISCTYKIEDDDNLAKLLLDTVKNEYSLQTDETEKILDENKIGKLKELTLTRTKEAEKIQTSVDETSFNIFCAAILDKPAQPVKGEEVKKKEKYIAIADTENEKVADLFWQTVPKIIFFDDFCDLLPDKIFLSVLKERKDDTKGYRAVKNLEKILKTDFI